MRANKVVKTQEHEKSKHEQIGQRKLDEAF